MTATMTAIMTSPIEELIENHRSYAHSLAAEALRTALPGIDRGELLSAAEFGLVQAAESFDASRGVNFTTFAYYRIRGAIYDCLRTASRTHKFEVSGNEYLSDYSARPQPNGGPESDYAEIRGIAGSVFTCYLMSIGPEKEAIERQERQLLMRSISALPEKNRQVLQQYYFDDLSFEEIGARMGLSKSWVCRIHAKSIDMVREKWTKQLSAAGRDN